MKLKSYFASTVEAAMALASQELGPDAMLVNSRRTTDSTRQLGEYEVVFALLPPEKAAATPVVALPSPPRIIAPAETGPVANLSLEISELRRRVDRMSSYFEQDITNLRESVSPAVAELVSELLNVDVEKALANEIATRTIHHPSTTNALTAALAELIRFDPTLGRSGTNRKVVALVGPPGCGKTSTLVKFAARFGLAARRPVHFLSTDTVRIAAVDQLHAYADILGSSFQAVETAQALTTSLEEQRHQDFILIDTPGLAARDIDSVRGLAEILGNHREVDVHLVVPASMRAAELSRVVSQYKIFQPRKLIFTRIDETCTAGSLINEAVRIGLPVSFVTTGQQVPEDLEPASASLFSGFLRPTIPNTEILAGAQNE